MRLYLTAKTNIPDVYVDFIEVRLSSGEVVSLNWDESDISRSDDGFSARYKGVYFNEEYANGRIEDLKGLEIIDIGLYFESTVSAHFEIEEMLFEDGDKSLIICCPYIPCECSGLKDIITKSIWEKLDNAKQRSEVSNDKLNDREISGITLG